MYDGRTTGGMTDTMADDLDRMTLTIMKTTKAEEVEAVLDLSMRKFIELNMEYIKEVRGGKLYEVETPGDCPLAQYVAHNDRKCHRETVPNTESCPLCGMPVCPDCMNHAVGQISRVTGYLSNVESWGAAKQQEFKDRQRHNI